SRSFPESGLHVLREGPGDFAVLRCGSVKNRFSQADQLHVDLWRRGVNVALDGGSYLYNDELRFHRYFMGTASHNTVTVDGQDQMLLHRRFKWLYWTPAALTKFVAAGGGELAGFHDGYKRLPGGPRHKRTVRALGAGRWQIEDRFEPGDQRPHDYVLQWLIAGPCGRLDAIESGGSFVFGETGSESILTCAARSDDPDRVLGLDAAAGVGDPPRGWVSRYYGEKTPACSVALRARARGAVDFFSEFRERT
ncbi:MAG: heparinase II/III-family protein, partial [Elusimicrobia bacterium]|nr:heparinase II/III-family protein [Elusimicrobiota bacterium]